jgi:hypothetical protein
MVLKERDQPADEGAGRLGLLLLVSSTIVVG